MKEYINTITKINDNLSIATKDNKCYWSTKGWVDGFGWQCIPNKLYIQILDMTESDEPNNCCQTQHGDSMSAYKTD